MPARTPRDAASMPLRTSTAERHRLERGLASERDRIMGILRPVVELMEQILPPNTELVLHDLTHPDSSVVALANGQVSGRAVGSAILSGPKNDQAFAAAFATTTESSEEGHTMIGVYPTVSPAGVPLKSATVIFRSESGTPIAALCANVDLGMLKLAQAWISRAIDGPVDVTVSSHPQAEAADMDALMAEIIESAVQNLGKPVLLMTKDEKTKAVEEMLRRGLFIVKGSVPRAAKALSLSRYTVYNYLDEIRQREQHPSPKGLPTTTPKAPTARKPRKQPTVAR